MIRIIGFIVGSIVSVGALLMLVGKPEFRFGSAAADAARYDVAIQQLREKQPVPALPEPTPDDPEATDKLENVGTSADTTVPIEKPSTSIEPLNHAAPSELDPPEDNSALLVDSPDSPLVAMPEPDWYRFWNPFRSEVAAAGFVRRLESVTGLDYRIDKVRAGVYEVAFSYGDDAELETKLARISAATGLDLTDSL